MWRFLWRIWRWFRAEIVLGFLIGTIFWAAILGWQAAYTATDAEKQKCHDAAERSGSKSKECKSFWERTTSDPVAFFTFWLAISTVGLGISTVLLWAAGEKQFRHARRTSIIQSRDMKASIDLARSEFISSHRPKIRIKHVWLVALGSDQPVTVDIVYANVGDTKAVISDIGMDFNVINTDARLPPDMTAPGRPYVSYPECGLGTTVRTGNVSSLGRLNDERIEAIRTGAKLLCCFGFVEYSDNGPLETRKIRRTAFCRIFKPSARAIDGMGRFVKSAEPDPDYEYED
ncbi:hypothetical protein [Bradyrhizobium sp.]|uniref:hypothetical protein n=1 Tax=Bradyrhizobium sp. TaxID=376 RepID=UPI003C74EAAE